MPSFFSSSGKKFREELYIYEAWSAEEELFLYRCMMGVSLLRGIVFFSLLKVRYIVYIIADGRDLFSNVFTRKKARLHNVQQTRTLSKNYRKKLILEREKKKKESG